MKKLSGKYIVNKKGEETSLILLLKKYKEFLEDMHDLSVIAERKDKPTISLKEIKKRLK